MDPENRDLTRMINIKLENVNFDFSCKTLSRKSMEKNEKLTKRKE